MVPPTCKNCQNPYLGRDVSRVPLMLDCGHSYCCSCLFLLSFKVTKNIQCPSCKAFTPVHHGEPIEGQLQPNLHLLGLTVAQELNLISTASSKMHKVITLHSRKLEKGGGVDKCKECLGAQVEVHCDQCKMGFCKKCFTIVHASANVLRTHTPTPLSQANSAPCPQHPDELQRHYCVESNRLMCVLCSLEEERKGRTILSLTQAAEDVRAELKPLLAQAERLFREITRTSQVLRDQVPTLQASLRSQVEDLSLATPTLFSLLQKRVQLLHRQLVETFDLYAKPAIQAHGLLQEYRVRVHATILRCNAILQDDVKVVQEKTELCEQLTDMSSFPARLREGANKTMLLEGAGEVRRLLLEEARERISRLGEQISEQLIEPPSLCTFSGDPYDLPAASPAPPAREAEFTATPPKLAPPPGFRSKSYSPYRGQGRRRHVNSSLSPSRRRNPSPAHISSRPTPTSRWSPQNTPPAGSLRNTSQLYLPAKATPTNCRSPQKTSPSGTPRLRPPTKVENLERVVVSFVKDVDEFYVQDCQQEKELKDLQEQLWTHCHNSTTQPNPSLIKHGLVCGAFSERYQQWYRVYLDDIISSEEGSALTVTVFYLDYGDTENLKASSLCVLPQKLRSQRPMASCCHLHQLRPPGRIPLTPAPHSWSYKATEKLKEYTQGTTLNMQVFEESHDSIGARMLAVDLIADNQLSIRQQLDMYGLAVLSKPAMPPQPAVLPRPIALEVGQTVGVVLIAAQTPWNFHVHIKENESEVEAIVAQLNTAFEMDRLPRLATPTLGAWVTARSVEHEDTLFRAKITSVDNAQVTVQYTDYGNEEDLPLDRLYVLPDDIASIKIQAIHCHLCDVAPPEGDKDWTHPISDYFHALLDEAQQVLLTVQEEGQPHKVKVQIMVDGVLEDAATVLVKEGKARWLLPRTPPVTSPETPEGPCTPPGDPSTPSTPSRSSESSVTSPACVIPCKDPILSEPQSYHQAAVSGPLSSSGHHQATDSLPNGEHSSASFTPPLPAVKTFPSIPPPLLPAVGEAFQCYVSHIDSPQCFHVIRSPPDPLPARPTDGQELKSIEVGGAAWAVYDDGEWYRVVYEGPAANGEGHKVHYVDSGDREVVKQLFRLSTEFSKAPCKAIPCSLAGTVDPTSLYQQLYQELTVEVQSISADGHVVVTL